MLVIGYTIYYEASNVCGQHLVFFGNLISHTKIYLSRNKNIASPCESLRIYGQTRTLTNTNSQNENSPYLDILKSYCCLFLQV